MRHVVFNQKGGVGKSSITVNLAAISAQRGLRTLVLDLDPQCNSTTYLLGDHAAEVPTTIADFFRQFLYFRLTPVDAMQYVHDTGFDNLSVIPAAPDLAEIESKLENRFKIYKLREAMQQLESEFGENARVARTGKATDSSVPRAQADTGIRRAVQ